MVFGGGVVSNAFGCFSMASGCLDTCVGSRYMLMVFKQYPDILVAMRRLGRVSLGSWQCVACCVGDVSMVSWGRVAGSRVVVERSVPNRHHKNRTTLLLRLYVWLN